MSTYSVAEAKARLSELIDRAERGEAVTITRHGRHVAEIKAALPAARPIAPAELSRLAERRARRKVKGSPVAMMLKWRDEGEL